MSLAFMIITGVVFISIAGIVGDIVSTSIKARAKSRESTPAPELDALRDRVRALETRLDDRDLAVRKLEDELRFVSRMLEDKTGRGA